MAVLCSWLVARGTIGTRCVGAAVRDTLGDIRSFALKQIVTFQIQSYCESVTPILTRFLDPDV